MTYSFFENSKYYRYRDGSNVPIIFSSPGNEKDMTGVGAYLLKKGNEERLKELLIDILKNVTDTQIMLLERSVPYSQVDPLMHLIDMFVQKLQKNEIKDHKLFFLINRIIIKYGDFRLSSGQLIKDRYKNFFNNHFHAIDVEWKDLDQIKAIFDDPKLLFKLMLDNDCSPAAIKRVLDLIVTTSKPDLDDDSIIYKLSVWASKQKEEEIVDRIIGIVLNAFKSRPDSLFSHKETYSRALQYFALTCVDYSRPSEDQNWSKTLLLLKGIKKSRGFDCAIHDADQKPYNFQSVALNQIGLLLCFLLSGDKPLTDNRRKVFDEILGITNFRPYIDFDGNGSTPLYFAANYHHGVEIFKSIYNRGCNFEHLLAGNRNSKSPLDFAIECGNWDVVSFIIDRLLESNIEQSRADSIASLVQDKLKDRQFISNDEISEKLTQLKTEKSLRSQPKKVELLSRELYPSERATSSTVSQLFSVKELYEKREWGQVVKIASSISSHSIELPKSNHVKQHLFACADVAKQILINLDNQVSDSDKQDKKGALIALLKQKPIAKELLDELIKSNDYDNIKKLISFSSENKITINNDNLKKFVKQSNNPSLIAEYDAAYPSMSSRFLKLTSRACGTSRSNIGLESDLEVYNPDEVPTAVAVSFGMRESISQVFPDMTPPADPIVSEIGAVVTQPGVAVKNLGNNVIESDRFIGSKPATKMSHGQPLSTENNVDIASSSVDTNILRPEDFPSAPTHTASNQRPNPEISRASLGDNDKKRQQLLS